MAAIFIAVGAIIAEKVHEKKQRREDKKARDELRYRDLQTETKARMIRTQSGNMIPAVPDRVDDEEDDARSGDGEALPPSYEDVAGTTRGRRGG